MFFSIPISVLDILLLLQFLRDRVPWYKERFRHQALIGHCFKGELVQSLHLQKKKQQRNLISWHCDEQSKVTFPNSPFLYVVHARFTLIGAETTNVERQKPINFSPFFQVLNLSGKKVLCSFKFNGWRQKQLPFSLFFKLDSFCFAICFKMNQKKFYFQRWLRLLKPRERS